MKSDERDILIQKIKDYCALLNYYNCLYTFSLSIREHPYEAPVYLIDKLKRSIFDLLISNPNKIFSLKNLYKRNPRLNRIFSLKNLNETELKIIFSKFSISDITSAVYQYYYGTDGDFSDEDFLLFIDNMDDVELKIQLEKFKDIAAWTEINMSYVSNYFRTKKSHWECFCSQNLGEVIVSNHKHLKRYKVDLDKEIIEYLNDKKEKRMLSDEQFNVFFKEYVEQLLYIILNRKESFQCDNYDYDYDYNYIFNLLNDFNVIASTELDEVFRAVIKEEILWNIPEQFQLRNLFWNGNEIFNDKIRKIIIEELVIYGKLHVKPYIPRDYDFIYYVFHPKFNIIPEDNTKYVKYLLYLTRKNGGVNPLPLLLVMNSINPDSTIYYIRNQNLDDEEDSDYLIKMILKYREDVQDKNIQSFVERLKLKNLRIEEFFSRYNGESLNAYRNRLISDGYDISIYSDYFKLRECDFKNVKRKVLGKN